jgi:hypothetical protein
VSFPFYDFYFQLLGLLLNAVKVRRMRELPAFEKTNDYQGFLKAFDHRFLLKYLGENASVLFRKLSPVRCPGFGRPLLIHWDGLQVAITIPEKTQARFLECRHALSSVLQLVSWSNFVLLFVAIFTEKHLVFVHPNREVVAHLM